jgi:ribosomal-protein-alanine N-acetyltransferase
MQDAPELAKLINDPEILKNLSNRVPNPYQLKDAEWFVNHSYRPPGQVMQEFAIVSIHADSPSKDRLIGTMGLEAGSDIFARGAELGYWLARSEWRKGYASEAAALLVDWGFGLEGGINGQSLLRISGNVFAPNVGSRGVLERVGLVQEGLFRDAVWKNGEAIDLVCLALTRRVWEQRKVDGGR